MTFIKIDRKMLSWEHFKEPYISHLFMYILLRANYEDYRFDGCVIERGSFITTEKIISDETGLSRQQVRTGLKKLIETKEISKRSDYKNTIISVKNYDNYQSQKGQKTLTKTLTKTSTKTPTKQEDENKAITIARNEDNISASNQASNQDTNQVSNQQIKEYIKNTKEYISNDIYKKSFGEYQNVKLTDKEIEKLNSEYGYSYCQDLIRYLDEYIEMKGYKAKSHYLAIRKWVVDAVEKDKAKRKYQVPQIIEDTPQIYDDSQNKKEDLSQMDEFLKRREQ